jgi:hypothetical protein
MKVSEVNDINIFAKVTFVYYYRSGIFELCHILEGFINPFYHSNVTDIFLSGRYMVMSSYITNPVS